MSGVGRRIGGYVAAIALLLVVWQVLSTALGSPALPGPLEALADLWRLKVGLAGEMAASGWRVVASVVLGSAWEHPLGWRWAARRRPTRSSRRSCS